MDRPDIRGGSLEGRAWQPNNRVRGRRPDAHGHGRPRAGRVLEVRDLRAADDPAPRERGGHGEGRNEPAYLESIFV